jgi:hypothetical protein
MNGEDLVSDFQIRANGFVAIFAAIGARADDRNRLWHGTSRKAKALPNSRKGLVIGG